MNPLKDLQKLVSKKTVDSYTGTVVAVSGQNLSVKTSQGVRQASSVGAVPYKVGDFVSVQGSVVLGKTLPASSLPVFSV